MSCKSTKLPANTSSLRLKIAYTVIIFCGHLTYGLNNSQIGTCMIDLKYLINGNSKEIASTQAITLQTTFLCVGGLLGGAITFIYKSPRLVPYINRQLITSLLLIFYGVANACVPQLRHLPLLYGAIFITGLGGGHWAAVTITWMIEMWGGWTRLFPPLLQAYHLVYGVGTILGPLLARPYLYGYMNETEFLGMNETEYLEVVKERRQSLQLPYAVSGTLHGFVGFFLFLFYLISCWRYQKPKTGSTDDCLVSQETSAEKPVKTTTSKLPLELPSRRRRLLVFTTLVFFLFAANNIAEFAYIFLDPFLQSLKSNPNLVISAGQAAEVSALYGTAYTIGRAASIPLALVLSPANLLLFHYTLGLLGSVGMFFSTTSSSLLFIQLNTALVAFALSALSSLFSYISRYSVVDDRANALYSVALMTPSIFTPLLMGHFLEQWPPILLVFELVTLVIAALIYLVIRFAVLRGVKEVGGGGGDDGQEKKSKVQESEEKSKELESALF